MLLILYSILNNLNSINNSNINNSTKIYNNESLIILYVLLFNLGLLLIVFLGFSFKVWYKKYIDNDIVI